MAEFNYEITKAIGSLSEKTGGCHKELNLISWNDGDPKYDIRTWQGQDHTRMGKGVSLNRDELIQLKALIEEELEESE